MRKDREYPKHLTYETANRSPSLLQQHFWKPSFQPGDKYYRDNALLEPFFSSDEERWRFGAAQFQLFTQDTIEVEQNLVTPAVAATRRLPEPWRVPPEPEKELYKTATDEGFHAEQSLSYLTELSRELGLDGGERYRTPLFLRRLYRERANQSDARFRHLTTVLNGVVTETRISIELGQFAADKTLCDSVRQMCAEHTADETIHASQFRALGKWLWSCLEDNERAVAAGILYRSTIARSLPDVYRLAWFLHLCTGRSLPESRKIVRRTYTPEVQINEMLVAARPTVRFLRDLGVENYALFSDFLKDECERLATELL